MKLLFKNFLSLFIVITFALAIAACGKDETTTTNTDTQTTDDTNTTTTEDTSIVYPNLNGKTIRILHGAPNEVDPFHDDYSGQFQAEKQSIQRKVEQNYNVTIEYELYPDGAGWGQNRVEAIKRGVMSGEPIGEIYAISSMWTGELADAEAIAPVKSAIRNYVNDNYDDTMKEFGSYLDDIYGFETGFVLNDSSGVYFNLDLVEQLGLENPAEKWNNGEWTWDDFEAYLNSAQAALDGISDGNYYAMGGVPSVWAQHMIPANGGYLVNPDTKRVAFDQTPALQTFNKLIELYNNGVWESTPGYDAGSADWLSGKVLLHPGELWFLNADNRWGLLDFDLGFVPYPLGNGKTIDDYKTGKDSMQLYAVSGGYNDPNGLNPENLFRIWNDLQYWQSFENAKNNFEFTLESRYNDFDSIEAHLSILDKIYVEQIMNLGFSGFSEEGWYTIANNAVTKGDANTYLSSVKQKYQEKLDEIFGGN